MNKTELVDRISEKAEVSKVSAARVVDAWLDSVKESLKKGDPVVIPKFGAFTVKLRPPREGRNPSTGEKIKIKAAKVVSFKAGKALKDAVRDDEMGG